MHNIPQSELTPQLRQLIRQTFTTHEPLKISIDSGQNVILLAECDYQNLLDSLAQIRAIVTQGPQPPKVRQQRVFGSAKGLIKIASDFDAPLDDFKDYR